MLLKHTPKEIAERSALNVNPAKTCQPVGAMYAALGIHRCLPHSHGSQGCCSYHRSTLTRHYKEPVMAGTSSFTEGASVFGGGANITQAIDNIFKLYEPDVIAVHTTCLSETIGDDIPAFVHQARTKGSIPEGKFVIHASTPSYVGSHVIGFANMTKGMVDYFSETTGTLKDQVNIIPGYIEPADMAEIKRLAAEMGVKTVLFPDTSGVLNGPMTGEHKMFPDGGVKIPELQSTGDSRATLALGKVASLPAAQALNSKCKVPIKDLDLPIGLLATDRFIDALRSAAGVEVPESIDFERGQLVDLLTDMEQYFAGKKVALSGDPDQLVALTEYLVSIGMIVSHVVTGTPGKAFEARIEEITASQGVKVNVRAAGDLFLLHQWIKNDPVDLIIGNTYSKYIAKDEDIPLVRMGFPIVDRIGHIYFTTVGYRGALRVAEKILDAIMDRQDRDADEVNIELVM